MPLIHIVELIAFILLLVLSAFFSASEMAFFSLSKTTVRRLQEEGAPSAELIAELLKKPKRLLVTILVGNTIVNVAAASLAAFFTLELAALKGWNEVTALAVEVVCVTAVILVFGEVTPKVHAVRHPEKTSRFVAGPMQIVSVILWPVTSVLTILTRTVTELTGKSMAPFSVTEDELKTMVDIGGEEGTLDKEEQRMIHSIFEFGETEVREVMIPRIDMICVENGTKRSDVMKLITSAGHTRLPIYEESVDSIRGILHAKDFLKIMNETAEQIHLLDIARKPYFVPESKKIDDLLREFQKEKIHMAIVVDEYGGTAGLVTLEDLLEEIVGEIQDEFDAEEPLYSRLDSETITVDAKINIYDLNKLLGADLPTDGFETLGGFILTLAGKVPKKGDEMEYENLRFTVEEVSKQRISQVRIHRTTMPENQETAGQQKPEHKPTPGRT